MWKFWQKKPQENLAYTKAEEVAMEMAAIKPDKKAVSLSPTLRLEHYQAIRNFTKILLIENIVSAVIILIFLVFIINMFPIKEEYPVFVTFNGSEQSVPYEDEEGKNRLVAEVRKKYEDEGFEVVGVSVKHTEGKKTGVVMRASDFERMLLSNIKEE